ncbi:MAG: 1-acyl-sn-glycerol-3-phosphate acyltransferase [Bacteroidales bacterium]|nr:1-acyl-sn-glycerol-3-phosphate acyltransferase [Bacteroidales bacterium]
MKTFAKIYFKLNRWKYNEFPDVKKAVVLMAPHTSMWDFVLGKLYFHLYNYKPKVLIKKEAFWGPFGFILKKMGGIPVDRGKRTGITDIAIKSLIEAEDRFYLVITPEGTRKKTKNWKKGFIRIAKAADVPVVMRLLNKKNRKLGVIGLLDMQGNDIEIMERLKKQYKGFTGLKKNKFETGYE